MVSNRMNRRTKRSKRSKRRRTRRRQRGGNIPLLDNSDNVPITTPSSIEFNVRFMPSLKATEEGTVLTIYQAQPEPHATWTAPPPNILYTLICWDPDAPEKSFLHWLIINCSGSEVSTGKVITNWSPPSPPSGQHRYIFGLFQQAGPLIMAPMDSKGGFNPSTFATQHSLAPLKYKGVRVDA